MRLSELLFDGGIAAMAVSAVLGIAALVVFKLRGAKLKRQLDLEYGKREKNA